ncbi:MAG: hypothetical protein K2I93_03100 [Oscillospiraceae bacterium]|nr:hypothetical protein [Oscillospiraceae bacterium]
MRLIDADKLKPDTKTFTSAYSEELTEFYSQKVIDNAPTIDAKPERHGEWINALEHCGAFVCSDCEYQSTALYKYCPSCGAKMDGGEQHT